MNGILERDWALAVRDTPSEAACTACSRGVDRERDNGKDLHRANDGVLSSLPLRLRHDSIRAFSSWLPCEGTFGVYKLF